MNSILVTSFYHFKELSENEVTRIREGLESLAHKYQIQGLVILGPEGINSTLSLPKEHGDNLKTEMQDLLQMGNLFFKDSFAGKYPFHNFKIKIRPEIVTLNRPEYLANKKHKHLSPKEWEEMLHQEDSVVIDTRNDYEYEIGHFKGALNPNIKEFTEFPDYLKKSNIPKDKKIMLYCTGGIRCEKAIYEVEAQGYEDVFQLDGGILNYLKEYPNRSWDGECFVFDYRVAVDQNLKPTQQWKLCPHCGDPGDVPYQCVQCGRDEVLCQKCLDKGGEHETCSKNCAHHFRMGHKSTRIHWDGVERRGGATISTK